MPARPDDDMPRHGAYVLRLWETRSTQRDATRWRLSLEDIHTGEKHKFRDLEELRAFLEEWMGADVGTDGRTETRRGAVAAEGYTRPVMAGASILLVEEDELLRQRLRRWIDMSLPGSRVTSADSADAYVPTWRIHEDFTSALQDRPLAQPEQGKDERCEDERVEDEPITERTVVCIEDEPDMIALIKLALERHGVRLIGALGGREGLDLVHRMKPDLVLLDLMMPDVNGAEVLKRMKADDSLSAIPIIVITVLDPYYSAKQGVDLERIDGFIRKPFVPQELVETVNATLKPVP